MNHIDALSRNPVQMIIQVSFDSKIAHSQNTGEHIEVIQEILNTKQYENYILKNDALYNSHKCFNLIVVSDEMQLNVIKHDHNKGHFGCKSCE